MLTNLTTILTTMKGKAVIKFINKMKITSAKINLVIIKRRMNIQKYI